MRYVLHLGPLHLDFSGEIATYSSAFSAFGSNIRSTQRMDTPCIAAMEKMYAMTHHVPRGEDKAPFLEKQKKSGIRTIWNKVSSRLEKLSFFYAAKMNSLSVTIMNDEILTQANLEDALRKQTLIRDTPASLSYVPIEKIEKHISFVNSAGTFDSAMNYTKILSRDTIHYSDTVKKDDKDSILNLANTMDNNTESHSTNDTMENFPKTIAINEDASINIESFHVVSHSDVPPRPTGRSISHLFNVCRNAWKNLFDLFYYEIESLDIPKNYPRYLVKQQHRRKTGLIVRAKLRRSRHRKERTKNVQDDYETWQRIETHRTIQNNPSHTTGYDVLDAAQVTKQTSFIIFNPFDTTKGEQKKQHSLTMINENCNSDTYNTREDPSDNSEDDRWIVFENNEDESFEELKNVTKYPTAYIAGSPMKNNNCREDNGEETHERNSLRLRLLSESSMDSEDSFIIFEDSRESVCNNKMAEHPIGTRYVPEPEIKIHDKDRNREIYDTQGDFFRSRLLSENSVDSEDSFIVFRDSDDESSACKNKMHLVPEPGMKINDADCDREEIYDTQEDSFRSRLLSESSMGSEDSFIVFEESNDESLETYETEEAAKYPVGMLHPSTKIDDYSCKNSNGKINNTQRNSFHPQVMSRSCNNSDRGFCIIPSTQLAENCSTSRNSCDKMSFCNRDNLLEGKNKNDELPTETKKVSFNLNPIVHVMVKWDFAYRTARKGPWEEMARDNERFKGRINSIAAVLDPILTSQHRSRVWQERFVYQE